MIVSSHGGRQLDRTPAAHDALAGAAAEDGDQAEDYVDGGIRRDRPYALCSGPARAGRTRRLDLTV